MTNKDRSIVCQGGLSRETHTDLLTIECLILVVTFAMLRRLIDCRIISIIYCYYYYCKVLPLPYIADQ